jgi:H+/Cl- antiporter ClcA
MLIVEMTGNYSQMLPLLVSCFCAYAVTEYVKDLPIYEALLREQAGKAPAKFAGRMGQLHLAAR